MGKEEGARINKRDRNKAPRSMNEDELPGRGGEVALDIYAPERAVVMHTPCVCCLLDYEVRVRCSRLLLG